MLNAQPNKVRIGARQQAEFFKRMADRQFFPADSAAILANLDNDEVRLYLYNEGGVMMIKVDRRWIKNMKREFESADATLKAAKGLGGYPDYQTMNKIDA